MQERRNETKVAALSKNKRHFLNSWELSSLAFVLQLAFFFSFVCYLICLFLSVYLRLIFVENKLLLFVIILLNSSTFLFPSFLLEHGSETGANDHSKNLIFAGYDPANEWGVDLLKRYQLKKTRVQ